MERYELLIVDDEIEILRTLRLTFEKDFEVFTASEYAGIMNALSAGQIQVGWLGASSYATTWQNTYTPAEQAANGRRTALVSDMPGLTRDRREDDAEIAGHTVALVDTAGLEEASAGSIPAHVDLVTRRAARTCYRHR